MSPTTRGQCIYDANFESDVVHPWVAFTFGGALLILALICLAFAIFKQNPQKVDWVSSDSLKGQGGSPFLLHPPFRRICMYLAFPTTFVLGALHYNFELGYSWTSVIRLVWTLLDSSGHNLFQNRVTAAPDDNWDPHQMENNGQRNMTVAARTRNTYQGSSTAVFILVLLRKWFFLYSIVSQCGKMEGHVLKNHANLFITSWWAILSKGGFTL